MPKVYKNAIKPLSPLGGTKPPSSHSLYLKKKNTVQSKYSLLDKAFCKVCYNFAILPKKLHQQD